MRRLVTVCFVVTVIAWSGLPACAQPAPFIRRVTSEIDRNVQQAMDEAQEFIKQQQYSPAVARLQIVLDHPEDYFLQRDFRTKTGQAGGVKAQTNRILGQLPENGRAAYELQYGATARALLNESLSTNNEEKLIEVISRYQMTSAGFDAMQLLLASELDHDRLIEAAQLCEILAERPTNSKAVTGALYLRAAFAWHLAGLFDRSLHALQGLKGLEIPEVWRIAGRQVPPFVQDRDAATWMTANFGIPFKQRTIEQPDWKLPRGGVTGNETAMEACPAGNAWMISPLQFARIAVNDEANDHKKDLLEQLSNEIERALQEHHRLTQPAAMPLIVGDTVIYRTLNDVTAVGLKTGQLLWRSAVTDSMVSWLLQSPTAFSDTMSPMSPMTFRGYLRHKLFRDQLSGSLSSDGEIVYAIEDADSQFNPLRPRVRQQFGQPYIPEPANKLAAYHLQGGRLLWEIGGSRGTPPAELSGMFFLGPPLPFEGRLYCLAEVKHELQLVALARTEKSVRLEWSQSLISLNDGMAIAAPRRLAGLMPVVAGGIMICPTASGSVIAFNLTQRQLQWGYAYDSTRGRNQNDMTEIVAPYSVEEEEGRWLDGGALLANGRVLITPRDSSELHCVNLVDGKLIWKRPRDQGLYIAAIENDQVYVVGKSQVMSYSLSDGAEAWPEPLEIPEPSGRGIREGSGYLLPLTTGEIATLDLSSRRILGRSKLMEGHTPGNLAIAGGALVSCGTHQVVGFRSLPEIEQQIARLMAVNPMDPEALALRGELRLHRGDQTNAIRDLRDSLRQRSEPRVNHILAGTMLAVLKNDSAALMKAATELDRLIDEPQQRIEFLRLYAKSLSDAGDVVGAVKQLFRLAALPQTTDELIARGPGEFIACDQNIRSQLFTVCESAKAEQRPEMDQVFADELDASMAATDREQRVKRFVRLTIGHPSADRLLLHLADSKAEFFDELARTRLLERLVASRDKAIGAMATAQLASRSLKAGFASQARPWIEQLASDFATQIGLDGMTGRQLADEWLMRDDVRKAQIENAVWPDGEVEVNRNPNPVYRPVYPVEIVTHVGHHFTGWTFEVDQAGNLSARDPSLRIVWRLPLPQLSEFSRLQPAQLHIRGPQMAFLSGTQMVVMKATDPNVSPRIQFERLLRSPALSVRTLNPLQLEKRLLPNGRQFQSMFDINGTSGFLVGLSDESVVYQLDNRLIAADVDTGQVQWYRRGSVFAKSNATVDTTLVLHTPSNGAILIRPMDGTILHSRQGAVDEVPIWFGGTRRLSQRTVALDQQVLEMRDFEDDKIVWQIQSPSGTVERLVEAGELAILEPSGKLSIVTLETGETRLATLSPIVRPLGSGGVLAVQRFEDRYVIVGGVSSKRDSGNTTIELGPAANNSFTVDGFAFAIAHDDGQQLWSVPIEQLAFDVTQPARLPVLLLASRHNEFDPIGLLQQPTKLSLLILDKRTGKTLWNRIEAMHSNGRGAQFTPNADYHKLLIDIQGLSFELKFHEKE